MLVLLIDFRMSMETYGSEADVDSGEETADGFESAEAIIASCLGQLDSLGVSNNMKNRRTNE